METKEDLEDLYDNFKLFKEQVKTAHTLVETALNDKKNINRMRKMQFETEEEIDDQIAALEKSINIYQNRSLGLEKDIKRRIEQNSTLKQELAFFQRLSRSKLVEKEDRSGDSDIDVFKLKRKNEEYICDINIENKDLRVCFMHNSMLIKERKDNNIEEGWQALTTEIFSDKLYNPD